jgi:peptidoglycan/xylan/chitin deacetylase (PgdA/CDA1 family)
MRKKILLCLWLLCVVNVTYCFQRELALTIDDLPFVGQHNTPSRLAREKRLFLKMREILKREKVPVAAFVIPGSVGRDQWALIQALHDDGHTIANHTWSHQDANQVSSSRFVQDIQRADAALKPYMSFVKYFRYPFLHTGKSEKKRAEILAYLKAHDYRVAPISIDSGDWRFLADYYRALWPVNKAQQEYILNRYLNHVQQEIAKARLSHHTMTKQILLIHMNRLNADCLDRLIQVIRAQGYHFISLSRALSDPFYK